MKTQRKRYSSRVRKNASKRRNSVRRTNRRTKSKRTKSRRNLKGGANPFNSLEELKKSQSVGSEQEKNLLYEYFKSQYIIVNEQDSNPIRTKKASFKKLLTEREGSNLKNDGNLVRDITDNVKTFSQQFHEKIRRTVQTIVIEKTAEEYRITMGV